MNKVHSFAKVVLAATGIFFLIRIIASMPIPISLMIHQFSLAALGMTMASICMSLLCLAAIYYIFLHKLEWLAMWIIGKDEFPEPESQIQWLPATFRLVCLAAGMYCLFTVGWSISINLVQYIISKPKAAREGYKVIYTAKFMSIELIIRWLIMLAIGIYLVCGAPHFVRWQVKKTLEQCKQPLEAK